MDPWTHQPTNGHTLLQKCKKLIFGQKMYDISKKNVAQVLRITFKTMDNPIDGPTSRPSNGHTLMQSLCWGKLNLDKTKFWVENVWVYLAKIGGKSLFWVEKYVLRKTTLFGRHDLGKKKMQYV